MLLQKARIYSSHFLYTTKIHLLVVSIDFSRDVCALSFSAVYCSIMKE